MTNDPKAAPGAPAPKRGRTSLLARGESMLWITGGSLVLGVVMIIFLLGLVLSLGMGTFWPRELQRVELLPMTESGQERVLQGEIRSYDTFVLTRELLNSMEPESQRRALQKVAKASPGDALRSILGTAGIIDDAVLSRLDLVLTEVGVESAKREAVRTAVVDTLQRKQQMGEREVSVTIPSADFLGLLRDQLGSEIVDARIGEGQLERRQLWTANFDLTKAHFDWIFDHDIKAAEGDADGGVSRPDNVYIFERHALVDSEKGRLIGQPVRFVERIVADDGSVSLETRAEGVEATIAKFDEFHSQARDRWQEGQDLREFDLGSIDRRKKELTNGVEAATLALQREVLRGRPAAPGYALPIAIILVLGCVGGLIYSFIAFKGSSRDGRPGDNLVPKVALVMFSVATLAALLTLFNVLGNQKAETEEQTAARIATATAKVDQAEQALATFQTESAAKREGLTQEIEQVNLDNQRYQVVVLTSDGREKEVWVANVVRAYAPNALGGGDKFGMYLSRWSEFLFDDPRQANSEGGVWPAIFGTVIMTLLMTVVVVPFGVLAALYLREYAKAGPIISVIRIAINNLAGVPSIVFGVFGLGFFCYTTGAWLDRGPEGLGITPFARWQWLGGLAVVLMLLAAAVIIGLRNGRQQKVYRSAGADWNNRIALMAWILAGIAVLLFVGPQFSTNTVYSIAMVLGAVVTAGAGAWAMLRARASRDPSASPAMALFSWGGAGMWIVVVLGVLGVLVWNPHFTGFNPVAEPTYGKSGLIWASMTLALLTLPVVIVSTEEALSAVPNSMREGSYACGASKWQTIKRIILPRAMPGIMTGTILAMARGAGEVAPLMLVGAVKLTSKLPVDTADWSGEFAGIPLGPLHPDRSFMHLGFHIYDLAFQSQDSEAARPMVYTTTLLLISIVFVLNVLAIFLRARLRRRFAGGSF